MEATLFRHSTWTQFFNRRSNSHALNKQSCQWSLWSDMMLYTTMELTGSNTITSVQFTWALPKYTSGQYVLNRCYTTLLHSRRCPVLLHPLPHHTSRKIRAANSTMQTKDITDTGTETASYKGLPPGNNVFVWIVYAFLPATPPNPLIPLPSFLLTDVERTDSSAYCTVKWDNKKLRSWKINISFCIYDVYTDVPKICIHKVNIPYYNVYTSFWDTLYYKLSLVSGWVAVPWGPCALHHLHPQ
jgi:hypothetical protein